MSGAEPSCIDLNLATDNNPDRVGLIADARPNCGCELEPFSEYSPGLVHAEETIVRMVCVPMHVHLKKLELKTSFFSHMTTFGASVQRLEHASDAELLKCVEDLTQSAEDRVWLGVVEAKTQAIRALQPLDGKQSFCVLDAALSDNPAHAEIHSSWRIPEADQIEYRVALRNLFVQGGVKSRRSLRAGAIWDMVKDEIRARPLPAAWASLA